MEGTVKEVSWRYSIPHLIALDPELVMILAGGGLVGTARPGVTVLPEIDLNSPWQT